MKLLLDESIPRQLSAHFPDSFHVRTVPELGWSGTKNGVLLQLAAEDGFDALITADRGIEYQQNLAALPVTVVVMIARRTRLQDLKPLVPRVVDVLHQESIVGVYRVGV